ncbi:MAG TPA: glycoside hydrolase family 88 protein [Planctomicrobium sp.]|nr:glycoside hydrolase family 88 protein [Planctomicrobium sp.]
MTDIRTSVLTAVLTSVLFIMGLLSGFPAMALAEEERISSSSQIPVPWPGATSLPLGRNDQGDRITAWMDPLALDPLAPGPLVALLFDDQTRMMAHASRIRKELQSDVDPAVRCLVITAESGLKFPPKGSAYNTSGQRTAVTLWRALGWIGPDFVVDCSRAQHSEDFAAKDKQEMLWQAVRSQPVARIGTVDSCWLPLSDENGRIPMTWDRSRSPESQHYSPLRAVLRQRLQRTPEQCVEQLSTVYGRDFKTVMYQPALAVMARLDRADATEDTTVISEIEQLLEPWLQKAASQTAPAKNGTNGSVNSGHLIFAAWGARTGDPRAIQLVRQVADHAFDAQGKPFPALPGHQEMSDAVFMACPILTSAGRLTGEGKYLEMSRVQLRFMQKLCLRPDGLYRHSPLCEAAWGRGNGFPMLGLALSLTDLEAIEEDKSRSPELRDQARELKHEFVIALQNHATALLPHQDSTGMWRQVIDEPDAYREMTATCMIGFALQRGINRGWLDQKQLQPAVDRAWPAVLLRCGSDGVLFDVCTGTGKQKTLQDYFDRTAILDRDERGGAMALLFAVEQTRRPSQAGLSLKSNLHRESVR